MDQFVASTFRMLMLLAIAFAFFFAYILISIIRTAVYNLYFHPLRNLGGPKTWIAFPFMRHIASIRGLLDEKMRGFHNTYGPVVRYSTDEVSFITAQAWKDIYGHGHQQLPKNAILPVTFTPNIITANDIDHTRFRKALAHAFSDRALRDQEPMITSYVDLLIGKLKDCAASGEPTDMVKWYNLTTFDIIGDLAFGQSFNGLRDAQLHEWVKAVFQSVKILSYIRVAKEFPLLMKIFVRFFASAVEKAKDTHKAYLDAAVKQRINNQSLQGRSDFMDAMMKHQGEKDGLTEAELVSNSNILIIAGSETTATLLSGVTFWLMKSPEFLRKVTKEVRDAFATDTEINFYNATQRLPYMLAVLTEGSRMYPPVPAGLQRRIPPGPPINISGLSMPPSTLVAVHQSAAYWSPLNFREPRKFIPERWLPEASKDTSSPFYNDNRDVLEPFSVGPRNCLGRNLANNEMRLILARVLWNFDLELCSQCENWADQKTYALWEKPALLCRLRYRAADGV